MIQVAKVIEIDEMAKAITDTVEANKNLDITRIEWFAEFGYGDDFEGYSHPTQQQVSDIGTVRPVSDSELSNVVDGVLLNFTKEELMQKLATDDLVDAVNKAFEGVIPDDLYVHSERGYPVVEYMFESKYRSDDTVSIEVHPHDDSYFLEDDFYFISSVDDKYQRRFENLDQAAQSFKSAYNQIKQEQEYEEKPKAFGM